MEAKFSHSDLHQFFSIFSSLVCGPTRHALREYKQAERSQSVISSLLAPPEATSAKWNLRHRRDPCKPLSPIGRRVTCIGVQKSFRVCLSLLEPQLLLLLSWLVARLCWPAAWLASGAQNSAGLVASINVKTITWPG